jgi:hypothetical protein
MRTGPGQSAKRVAKELPMAVHPAFRWEFLDLELAKRLQVSFSA